MHLSSPTLIIPAWEFQIFEQAGFPGKHSSKINLNCPGISNIALIIEGAIRGMIPTSEDNWYGRKNYNHRRPSPHI